MISSQPYYLSLKTEGEVCYKDGKFRTSTDNRRGIQEVQWHFGYALPSGIYTPGGYNTDQTSSKWRKLMVNQDLKHGTVQGKSQAPWQRSAEVFPMCEVSSFIWVFFAGSCLMLQNEERCCIKNTSAEWRSWFWESGWREIKFLSWELLLAPSHLYEELLS